MAKRLLVKVNEADNVAIAVKEIKAGTQVSEDLVTRQDIPQAHKVALERIPKGQPVIRYGVILGYALEDIEKGDWINEFMLELPTPPSVDDMKYGKKIVTDLPTPPVTTFEGYRNPNGGYAGTRNILGISTTVQCVTGVLNVAVKRIKEELLPKYPHVDDVVPINHAYGCGVAINAPEAKVPIRALRNLVHHPNFGGQVMVVALGCEKLTVEKLLDEADISPENVIVLQEQKGFDAMVNAIMEMADKKLAILNQRRRETLPLSDLCIGMQCGGGTFGYGAAQKNSGDHRICGEAGGQSLEDRQDVPHKRRTDHGAKPPVRQHDPAGRQADFSENGAGIELVPRVTVVRCCFLLKKQVQNAAMCDFPRMSGCNSGKILYNGMSGIFCSQQNDIGQERQNVMEYARIGNRRMLL